VAENKTIGIFMAVILTLHVYTVDCA